jgi:hypothetical protein
MRLHYWRQTVDDEPECMPIRDAKKLLKEKGGHAWTEHYERDGTLFETSPIILGSNRGEAYAVTYNRHL